MAHNKVWKILRSLLTVLLVLALTASCFLLLRDNLDLKRRLEGREYTPEDARAALEAYQGQELPDGTVYFDRQELLRRADEVSGLTELLSTLFPDRIVFFGEKNYRILPVREDLLPSGWDRSLFTKDEATGRISYETPDGAGALMGVDVSDWQENIDWAKAKADGVSFAILRAGARGYGAGGRLIEDTEVRKNLEGCKKNGIPAGLYFYTMALTEEEVQQEFDLVKKAAKGYQIEGPVVVDVEFPDGARSLALSPRERTDLVLSFCDKIRAAGWTPMVYANMRTFHEFLELERLEGVDKWFAQYFDRPYYPYAFGIWQYTSEGRVDGIPGSVDIDLAFPLPQPEE